MVITNRSWMESAFNVETPAYIINLDELEKNLQILHSIEERTGAKILLAFKGFSCYHTFPLIREYLSGAAVSSPFEAKLAWEHGFKEIHSYSPAYSGKSYVDMSRYSDHVVFNSLSQLEAFHRVNGKKYGLRMNPQVSIVDNPLYDACAPGSRFGSKELPKDLSMISGIHWHNLCEMGLPPLLETISNVEVRFGHALRKLEWVNFGGGHHITREDYDREGLAQAIDSFQQKYGVQVYLEPSEAIAIGTGVLVTTVLDVGEGFAIVDSSPTCHTPDVIEAPYQPDIVGQSKEGFLYRIGGVSCLSGDVYGEYRFPAPLKVGDKLVVTDMAHYTMVKNTSFNGIQLPSIVLQKGNVLEVVKTFGYKDYKIRL